MLQARLHAQTWSTDDFQLAPGLSAYSAQGQAWGISQNGDLFNVGYANKPDGTTPAVIRAQTVASGTVQNLAIGEFLLPGGANAAWNVFASGPVSATQNLFVGGYASDTKGSHWMINASSDGGATWSILNEYQYAAGLNAHCFGLATDGAATLYAAGSAVTKKGGSAVWLVRKGSLGSSGQWAWTVVANQANGSPHSVSVLPGSPQSTVFVAGSETGLVQNSYKPTTWVTRRSTNGGSTWATVDTFPTTRNSYALSSAVDSKGNVTVAGFGWNGSPAPEMWVVRQSMDGGNSWAAIDSTPGRAFGVTTVPRTDGSSLPDDVYVSGDVTVFPTPTTSSMYWVVRKLTASLTQQGTISWTATVVDSFQPVNSQSASADGGVLFAASSGDVCVTGTAADSAGKSHWITRTAPVP